MSTHVPEPMAALAVTAAQADALVVRFMEITDGLIGLVEQETELVRAGRLRAATKLAQPKADLTRLYITVTRYLHANQQALARIVPKTLATLRARHDAFQSLLQTNLTVLATAHAVSEGIIRGVSGEMARKSAPQTYGATGRATPPSPGAAGPLALSRAL
jgi:hypothetical protein